jgi:chromosome partitioning protein
MARVICISNHKGGVGKTTLVANLGFALARHFKVLLVDLDPQANLSSGLGFADCKEDIGKYFKEIIHFRSPSVAPYVINEYVHIIPCKFDLLKAEIQLHEAIRSESILKEILRPIQNTYDLILLDCPPSMNLLTLNALNCSNLILVPAKPEIFSIHGIKRIKEFADQKEIPLKIIFNQVNVRSNLHQKVIDNTKRTFREDTLCHTIKNRLALAEAFEHAQNIFHYKNDSPAAEDFTVLSDELLPFI